jgi:hypothetical protein
MEISGAVPPQTETKPKMARELGSDNPVCDVCGIAVTDKGAVSSSTTLIGRVLCRKHLKEALKCGD